MKKRESQIVRKENLENHKRRPVDLAEVGLTARQGYEMASLFGETVLRQEHLQYFCQVNLEEMQAEYGINYVFRHGQGFVIREVLENAAIYLRQPSWQPRSEKNRGNGLFSGLCRWVDSAALVEVMRFREIGLAHGQVRFLPCNVYGQGFEEISEKVKGNYLVPVNPLIADYMLIYLENVAESWEWATMYLEKKLCLHRGIYRIERSEDESGLYLLVKMAWAGAKYPSEAKKVQRAFYRQWHKAMTRGGLMIAGLDGDQIEDFMTKNARL